MIALALKPAVVWLTLTASGAAFPNIDYHATCVATAGGDGLQHCMDDERYARRKLVRVWSRLPARYRSQCVLDPMPPYPSYLLLRDCINNNLIIDQKVRD